MHLAGDPLLDAVNAPPDGPHVPLNLFQALGKVLPIGMTFLGEHLLQQSQSQGLVLHSPPLVGRPILLLLV